MTAERVNEVVNQHVKAIAKAADKGDLKAAEVLTHEARRTDAVGDQAREAVLEMDDNPPK